MKSTFLKFAKWGGIVFGVVLVLATVSAIVDPEGTKRRAEESKAKAAAKQEARQANKNAQAAGKPTKTPEKTPPGFTFGFLTGSLYKTKGMKKPSSEEVDAMARRSADENNIEHGQRSWYVGNYTQAFWMGWNRAK